MRIILLLSILLLSSCKCTTFSLYIERDWTSGIGENMQSRATVTLDGAKLYDSKLSVR